MKYSWRIAFSILLIIWLWLLYNSYEKISRLEQENLNLTTKTTIIETIWDMTCIWSWVNWEIRWHANCTYSWFNSKLYSGEFYNHNLNWYGIIDIDHQELVEDSSLTFREILQEWFFLDGKLMIWENDLQIWFFDENWNLKKWIKWGKVLFWGYEVWEFLWWILLNWFYVNNFWCKQYENGIPKDITKTVTNTVTNTVYRNNPIDITKGLVPINPLWSQSNPYNVKIELK